MINLEEIPITNLKKLTIIIPTHEREQLLKRSIEYYKKWNCQIIVVDSSLNQYNHKIPNNFNYIHLPKKLFGEKLFLGISKVKTPYSCFCADDDFLAQKSLNYAIEFLENNTKYSSVQGNYLRFHYNGDKISYKPIYKWNYSREIDGKDSFLRIKQSFSPYIQQFYALQRTEILKKSIKITSDVLLMTLIEVSTAIVSPIYGKHKILPIFWSARDSTRYTDYNDSTTHTESTTREGKINLITYNFSTIVKSPEWNSYLESLKEIYPWSADYINFKHFLSKTIEESIHNTRGHKFSYKIKMKIRKCLPKFILIIYRKFCQPFKYRFSKVSSVTYKTLSKKEKKIPGYPWNDANANSDWIMMEKCIIKTNTNSLK